jgi:hypothetical protein
MMPTAQVATGPKFTCSTKHADFTKPFTVSWDPQGLAVKRYWLCVGTKDGCWDVCSEDMGESLQHTIDVSKTGAKKLHFLLICSVHDPETGMEKTFDADQITVEAV